MSVRSAWSCSTNMPCVSAGVATYTVVCAQVVDLFVPGGVPEVLAHELDAVECVVEARLVRDEAG